ncbi:MAG TPA: polyphosphate kinase 1, partial [Burkholderiales bacterium]|nr:polyphosphate kinase 1 [Burkholderiales bacterium]
VCELFPGMHVRGCYQFRVTRNSELFVDEEEIKNLHTALQGELFHRHFGDAVRLEVADNCSQHMVEFLQQQFGLQDQDLYRVEGPVNLYRMREVPDQVSRPDLKYAPFQPGLAATLDTDDLFEVLKKQDVLLHHPYQAFLPVLDYIRTVAEDPNVIAIKQTVYRTGTDSELMEILVDAARKGKEVTVVVELMARFDEEVNMNWAARLEEVGAHVVYGVVGHKTHAKMSLIVRREETDHGKVLRKQDVLLHHPFQSFLPVIDYIRTTAADPNVIAIKQTVYRTGTDSELMEILVEAARKGKEVTVVVELMARFDEEANLNWAARLEEVGAHVVYGVVGHKTHAKMALVVRREDGADGKLLRRYVHLSTGNYHPATARQYTDFGLMTANEDLCADVNEVFKQLTGLGRAGKMKHVWQSPFTLHKNIIAAIRGEARLAAEGKPARIIAKMNSLLEPRIIEELYAASAAGVKIDLIVRGVCALKPGIAGLSENIRVRSIVGRFLEHSRVFYFQNGGSDEVYLASADWMDRNFFRRIELCFPVLDPALKRRVIREGLQPYLDDNCQAWAMAADGSYEQLKPRRRRRSAQEELLFTLATPT